MPINLYIKSLALSSIETAQFMYSIGILNIFYMVTYYTFKYIYIYYNFYTYNTNISININDTLYNTLLLIFLLKKDKTKQNYLQRYIFNLYLC